MARRLAIGISILPIGEFHRCRIFIYPQFFFGIISAKMTSLIHRAAKKAGTKEQKSVLILGAGNCNDLDLFTLVSADAISKIYLLDIDAHAVQAGVVSQWERVLVKEGLPASLVCEGDSKPTMKGLASVPLDDETTFTVLSSSNPLCSLKRRIYILPSTDVTGIAEDLSLFSSSTTLEEVKPFTSSMPDNREGR